MHATTASPANFINSALWITIILVSLMSYSISVPAEGVFPIAKAESWIEIKPA